MTRPSPDAKDIFLAAIECPTPEALQSFLSEACDGDAAVRQRVEVLLRAYEQAGNFLGGSASFEATANMPPAPDLPMKQIGPYKLLQQIGEGGMGLVYMAEQTEPIHRKVAIKLVKSGLENRQAAARFEAERQALALMEHQNIAKVLDAGTTDSGQPYFVMELVHGLPITKYCDQHRLSPRQRLELFMPVCQAVQHAHQKGIIHRDLKPSNVLIALYDGQPVPKVIDFGVAKALGQKLTDKTMFTEFGAIVGTLEYMSPEQAEKSHLDVDTRSDIYSLGVLLYELLTGTTPLDRQRMKSVAVLELLRIIKEEEPPKPSTRLSTIETLASIAANRSLDPKKLSGIVRGELDWIVMKALEKDRNRRYETANGFAADLQRYLADEPVVACPPSAAYRFRKFARRNKGLLAGATAVGVALIGGIIVSTLLMFRAMRAEELADERLQTETVAKQGEADARQTAEAERDKALAAEQRAALERDRAEVGFTQARAAVNQYLTQVSESQLLTVPGLQPLRRELLKSALRFYEDFLGERGNDPTIRSELAAAQLRMDGIYRELGMYDEAKKARASAHTLYETLLQTDPDNPEFQYGLSKSLTSLGELSKAIAVLEPLVQVHPERDDFLQQLAGNYNSEAISAGSNKLTPERLRLHRLALEIQERLVRKSPDNLEHRSALGMTLNNIGVLLSTAEQLPAKLDMYRRAVEQNEIVFTRSPHLIIPGRALATSYSNIAGCHEATGNAAAAGASYQRSVEILRKLAIENPAVPWIQASYGVATVTLARWQREHGMEEESQHSMLVIQQILSRLPRETAVDQYNLACFHAVYSAAIVADQSTPSVSEQEESAQNADRAIAALKQAVASGFNGLQLLNTDKDLDSLRNRDDFLAVVEQVQQVVTIAKLTRTAPGQSASEGLENQTRLLEIRREQAAKDPQNPQVLADLALNHYAIGVIQSELAQWESAATSLAEAQRLREDLVRLEPDNRQRQFDLAATFGKQSNVAEQQGQVQPALDAWNAQLQLLNALRESQSDDAETIIALGSAWYSRGESLWASSRYPEALPCWEEGRQILQRGREALPEATTITRILASREVALGNLLGARGYFQLASKHWANSLTVEHYHAPVEEARLALAAAWLGRQELYRETCGLLLAKAADEDPRHVAWVGALLPDSGIPPERLVQLAEEALRRDSQNQLEWQKTNLCRAKYRAGVYEVPQGWSGRFLRAMIEWKRGGQEQATKWLLEDEREYVSQAERAMAGVNDPTYQPLYGHSIWWEEFSTRLMRKEAWELIEGRVPVLPAQLLVDSRLWERVGNAAEADKALRAALADAPTDPAALAVFAASIANAGELEWAREAFDIAIERNPESLDLWLARARFHIERGHNTRADADLAHAATLNKDYLHRFLEDGWWVSDTAPDASGWLLPETGDATNTFHHQFTSDPQWRFIKPVYWEGEFFPRRAPGLKEASTVYVVNYVYSLEPKAVTLLVGGNQPIELSVNGRHVYQWKAYSSHYNLDRVPVLLKPGRNTIVIQLIGPVEDKGIIFRIGDSPLDRGLELAYLGLWDQALPLLKAAFADGQPRRSQNSWLFFGRTLYLSGDKAGYDNLLREAIEWAPKQNSADAWLQISQLGSLAPQSPEIASRLAEFVDNGVAKAGTKSSWMEHYQTVAYFRVGRFQEVLDRIGKRGGTQQASLRALCYFHLGELGKAETELASAERMFVGPFELASSGAAAAHVSRTRHGILDWAPDVVLLQEARQLISPEGKSNDSVVTAWRDAVRRQVESMDQRLMPFEFSLIYDGGNPHRWLESGRAHAELGNWERAQADFDRAVSMDAKRQLEILAARGRNFAELGRIAEAVTDFQTVLTAAPSAEAVPNLSEIRNTVRLDATQWSEVYERLAELCPEDVDLIVSRARRKLSHRDWIGAAGEYGRCTELLTEPGLLFEAAAACQLAGKDEEARAIGTRLVEEFGSSTQPTALDALVRTGALLPSPGIETERLRNWAGQLASNDVPQPDWATLLVLYRSGAWKELLDKITATSGAVPSRADSASLQRNVLRSTALYQLGRQIEAEALVTRELDVPPTWANVFVSAESGRAIADRLTLELLRQDLEKIRNTEFGAWTSLFNGQDLTGWVANGASALWTVHDGILVGVGDPGYLFSERSDYTDFQLRVEAKMSSGGDSGVLIRTELGDITSSEGIEVQICYDVSYAGKTGSIWTALPWKRVVDVDSDPVQPGTWFDMDIFAQGSRLLIRVNGEKVAEYADPNHRFRSGRLALQLARQGTRVEFRRIEIREIQPNP